MCIRDSDKGKANKINEVNKNLILAKVPRHQYIDIGINHQHEAAYLYGLDHQEKQEMFAWIANQEKQQEERHPESYVVK